MKYNIAVLDNISLLPEAKDQLQELASNPLTFPDNIDNTEQELISRTGNAEAILVSIWARISASYLTACPTVKYIGLCGTSTSNIDLGAVTKHGIAFSNVTDYGDEPAAEYMFMLLLMLARGEGKYQWRDMPCELMGKSIGIVGLGSLGKAIANLALGFKMKVNYYSLHRNQDWEKRGLKFNDLKTLLQVSEIVAICTPTNTKVLGKEEFVTIRANSVLLYASSGEALDKASFLKWIAKDNNYALFNYSAGDQYYKAFKDLPRVIFPKVIAGHTFETKQRLGKKVIENLKNYFNKKQ